MKSVEPCRSEDPEHRQPFLLPEIPNEWLRYLLNCSRELSSTFEPAEAFERIVLLPLPRLAEGCILHLHAQSDDPPLIVASDPSWDVYYRQGLSDPFSDLRIPAGGTEDQDMPAALTVPLLLEGDQIGVLHLLRTGSSRRFTDLEQAVLYEYARHAALAVAHAWRHEQAQSAYLRERGIAETFQKSFLPHLPQGVPGLEVAHRYVPAQGPAQVGGDFYELFRLGSNHYGFALGDVSGKGIEAAILTAMAKYNLRGLVTEFLYPETVLAKLSGLLSAQLPPERFVSLFYGVFNLRGHQLLYANAGHEAALVEGPDGGIDSLEPTGPVVGLLPDSEFHQQTLVLEPGSSLLLYTDGLSEARQGKTLLGSGGVAEFFAATRGQPPQRRIDDLIKRVRQFSTSGFRDDVAVMLLHLPTAPETQAG